MALFDKTPSLKDSGGDVVTVIGSEAYFHGVITVRGSLRIEGEVEGNVHEAQTVVVGRNGRVKGDVCAEHVVVGGAVEGEIVAARQLEIISGGKVTGNIRTARLLIEDGALFEGSCVMSGAEKKAEPRPPKDEPAEASEEETEKTETVSS